MSSLESTDCSAERSTVTDRQLRERKVPVNYTPTPAICYAARFHYPNLAPSGRSHSLSESSAAEPSSSSKKAPGRLRTLSVSSGQPNATPTKGRVAVVNLSKPLDLNVHPVTKSTPSGQASAATSRTESEEKGSSPSEGPWQAGIKLFQERYSGQVLTVTCGKLRAGLDVDLFDGRSKCIRYQGELICRTMLERLAGLAHRKSWSDSIHFNGRSMRSVLRTLVEEHHSGAEPPPKKKCLPSSPSSIRTNNKSSLKPSSAATRSSAGSRQKGRNTVHSTDQLSSNDDVFSEHLESGQGCSNVRSLEGDGDASLPMQQTDCLRHVRKSRAPKRFHPDESSSKDWSGGWPEDGYSSPPDRLAAPTSYINDMQVSVIPVTDDADALPLAGITPPTPSSDGQQRSSFNCVCSCQHSLSFSETATPAETPRINSPAPLPLGHAYSWTTSQIAEFISRCGWQQFAPMFEAEEIDGRAFLNLRESHLSRFGMRLGPCLNLLHVVTQLRVLYSLPPL